MVICCHNSQTRVLQILNNLKLVGQMNKVFRLRRKGARIDLEACVTLLSEIDSSNMSLTMNDPSYMRCQCYGDLAHIYAKGGEHQIALDTYIKALESYPDAIGVRFKYSEWLHRLATTDIELERVIQVLRQAIKLTISLETVALTPSVTALRTELEYGRKSYEKLALLLAQMGREGEVEQILITLGYTHRLSSHVLFNPSLEPVQNILTNLVVYDNFFDNETLTRCKEFLKPKADFWTAHDYSEVDSNGYFSYVQDLSISPTSFIEQVILQIFETVKVDFPEKAKRIRMAEWWCHSRYHSHGTLI